MQEGDLFEEDFYSMKLESRVDELEAAIRKHRDQRGDDRCWLDDEELYKVLPEGYNTPSRDTAVELDNCRKFIECRGNPGTEYISPERSIEELREALYWCYDKLYFAIECDGNLLYGDIAPRLIEIRKLL